MDVPKLEQERSVVVEVGSLDERLKNVEKLLLHIPLDHSQNHVCNLLSATSCVDVVMPISVCPFSILHVLLMQYSIVLIDLVAEVASP